MNERKVKGKPVVYTPVGETFVAHDGKMYRAVSDRHTSDPCQRCDFTVGKRLCGFYCCIADDRADGEGVYFERVEE